MQRHYFYISNQLFLAIIFSYFIIVIFCIVNELATLPCHKSLRRNGLALTDLWKTKTVDVFPRQTKLNFSRKRETERERKSDTNHKSQCGISHNFFIFPSVRDLVI